MFNVYIYIPLPVQNDQRIAFNRENVLSQHFSDIIDSIPQILPGSGFTTLCPQNADCLASGYLAIHTQIIKQAFHLLIGKRNLFPKKQYTRPSHKLNFYVMRISSIHVFTFTYFL